MRKMKRIKLFSRVKLFSSTLHQVKCQDCGEVLETAANVSQILCPHCGGKRFNIYKKRDPILSKDGELKESELTKNLKKFSGQTLPRYIFERTFSGDVIEKGYASEINGGYLVSPYASEVERMFSKISITVTREIDLDPVITSGECPISEAINGIDGGPEKGIMFIRKAHGVMKESPKNWIEDSHIIDDLRAEYSGESKGIKQFMDILNNRYPDAPENIIDDLVSRGAITINGNQITINK